MSENDNLNIDRHDVEAVNKKENRPLYKKREKIHPKRVKGTFRNLKWWIMLATLSVYYVVPWIRWDRGPGIPDQAVLIDIPARRFYFGFIEIWPQEVYYLTGLLIFSAFALFLVTSLVGRAWCGYACPQTVWTDLFLVVERFIEGDRNKRIRLDRASWSVSKITKRVVKHVIWLLISVATGGAWVFYFADAPTFFKDLVTLQAPFVAYATIGVLTFMTYTFGGFMREQVCTYMCPWPRIQGAMMDEGSLTVTYKESRGEPRGPLHKGQTFENRGDCVDCNACVVACPMGIDIRDGQQLECITCALCIDACDTIMGRIGRPRGLIGYATVAGKEPPRDKKSILKSIFRGRVITYTALMVAVGSIMLFGLITRSDMSINVLRDRNPLYVKLSDGSIRNGYTFKILNKSHLRRTFMLGIKGLKDPDVTVVGNQNVGSGMNHFTVDHDRVQSYRLFIAVSGKSLASPSRDIEFILTDINSGRTATYDSVFRGPEK